VSQKPRAAQEF